MKISFIGISIALIVQLVNIVLIGYLFYLLIRALRKYINSSEVRQEKAEMKKSLGEAIKAHRTRCGMTQEFLAEQLGVSRQAVSKWESGKADPSTSNLLALAKLFDISPEELLREVERSSSI